MGRTAREHEIDEADVEVGRPKRAAAGVEAVTVAMRRAMVARHLRSIEPDQAIFYTSGKVSNEAAYLYQLFARAYGTNNLPDCSNMCHESSGAALVQTIGIGKGSVSLADFDH